MAEKPGDGPRSEWWEFWKADALPPRQDNSLKALEARRAQLTGAKALDTLKEILEIFERMHNPRILRSALDELEDYRESDPGLPDPYGRFAVDRLAMLVEETVPDPRKDPPFPASPVGPDRPTGEQLSRQVRGLLERWDQAWVMDAVSRRRELAQALRWTVVDYLGGGHFQQLTAAAAPKIPGAPVEEPPGMPDLRPFNDRKVMRRFAELVLKEEPEHHAEREQLLHLVEIALRAEADPPAPMLPQHQEQAVMKLIRRAEQDAGARRADHEPEPAPGA